MSQKPDRTIYAISGTNNNSVQWHMKSKEVRIIVSVVQSCSKKSLHVGGSELTTTNQFNFLWDQDGIKSFPWSHGDGRYELILGHCAENSFTVADFF